MSRTVGLARALSKLGYCSRSQASQLIRAGRVRLNKSVPRSPQALVNLEKDRIEVDGFPVAAKTKLYLMMNKPRGVVTTRSDEKGRQTVYAYWAENLPWVAPVGRLDKASEGLLLFSNDSEWAARILEPRSHLERTYHVQVGAIADEALLKAMVQGIRNDGELLQARNARVIRQGKRNSWIEVVLDEGKNRQIRRILEHLGVEVLRLVRVAIGPLELGELPKGHVRRLTPAETQAIEKYVSR